MRAGPAADAAVSLARLGGALRASGVATTLRDEIDAAQVLALVDVGDRAEVREALRIALKIPRPAWGMFERVLAACWYGEEPPPPPPTHGAPPALPRGRQRPRPIDAASPVPEEGGAPETPPGVDGRELAWSAVARLRRKAFDEGAWSAQELALMEQILARLARRLAAHRSRRWVPAAGRGRGLVDPRRSYRRALRTSGELLELARRTRAVDEPRLVFLCDTSGSMDAHTRFLLAFVLSLRRAIPRAEVFAFNTELCRLTHRLARAPGRIVPTVERLGDLVPDWSGGTRIGASLAAFARDYSPSLVDARTVVVVLSDGLDCGDPVVLARALQRIHDRARRVVWLNPLAGDARYEPSARGMQAALPFVDRFFSAHNLESLERVLPHLLG